jgi:anti-sigma B factor antagonist
MTTLMDEGLPHTNGRGEPPMLGVLESRAGPRVLLTVSGEVDLASCSGLRAALEAAADSDAPEIWLDLTHVEFMDSTGLTLLIEAQRDLAGRSFAVICPDGPVRRVLAISGIDRAIAIHPSRSAAHSAAA